MAARDLHNNIRVLQLVNPATASASVTSDGLDTAGFSSCELLILMGASGDTLSGSVYWDLTIQHSADDSTWAACADADVIMTNNAVTTLASGVFATIDLAGEDDERYRIGYRLTKRYVRILAAKTGTHTNGTPIGVAGIMGHAGHRATADGDSAGT